jgi:hypothetical protein
MGIPQVTYSIEEADKTGDPLEGSPVHFDYLKPGSIFFVARR